MKQLKIKQLRIRNFKGIVENEIFFNDETTKLSGKNETGKTSVMDAFFWLFDGKDSFNRQDFGIKMLDENDKEIHNLIISVEGVFDFNGEQVILKKEQSEVWVTHTNDIEKTLKGNTIKYFINDDEVKIKDYVSFIEEFGPGQTSRSLMSALYFNESLDRKKRREIIVERFIKQTLLDYIKQNGYTELEQLNIKDYNTALKNLNDKIKSFDSKLDSIPIRIDEILLDIKEKSVNNDIEALKKERQEIRIKIKALHDEENSFTDKKYLERIKLIDWHISGVLKDKADLTKKKYELSAQNREKYDLQQQYERNIKEVTRININIKSIKQEMQMTELKVEEQRKEYVEQRKLTFNENDATCKLCGQKLPEDQKQEMKKKFEESKANKLLFIEKLAKEIKAKYRNLKSDLSQDLEKIERLNKDSEELKKQIAGIKEIHIDDVDYDAKIKKLEEEKKSIKPRTLDNSEKIDALQEEDDDISTKIASFNHIVEQQKRISELQKEHKELAIKQMRYKKLKQKLEVANRNYLSSIEGNINDKLGENIKVELFKLLINGTIKEVCNILIKTKTGSFVPYQFANTGSKVNAGIAFIKLLSDIENKHYPLWVDNTESVSQLKTIDTQMIILEQKKTVKKLTVN